MSDQEYIDLYLETINTASGNTKTLFFVGMVGLIGVGKSTFSQALGDKLGLYVASNDRIRRWLNEQGIPGAAPRQDLVQKIAEASSRYLYAHNISHILDADLIEFHDVARRYAAEFGARFFLFHLVASEAVILARINQRMAEGDKNQSRAGIVDYRVRRGFHQKVGLPPGISLTVSSEGSIDEEIERVIVFLKNEEAI